MVVVCTANVSRSPAAERLLRYGLDESVEVTSAGTMCGWSERRWTP